MQYDLSVIILTYNQMPLVRQTLQSLRDLLPNSQLKIQVIVVDNNSTEDVVGTVLREFPEVEVIANRENYGFAVGNNKAIGLVKGKYVLFLNSDTKLIGRVLDEMVQRLESDPQIGVVTCMVELADGTIDPACHRGFPTPWRSFAYYTGLEKLAAILGLNYLKKWFGGYHLLALRDLSTPHEIDACTGAFLMISKELGDQLGWWDEDYFMYGEDLDLCFRVKARGLKVMYYPECKIIHYKHSSGFKSVLKDSEEIRQVKIKTTKAFFEAMKIFFEKHYRSQYPAIVRKVVYLGIDVLLWSRLRKIISTRS
jgi:GT2 family glycosyltransferase